ncbi:MAG: hypothetical protein RL277_2360 [Planctomycetota bacterium]
MIAAVVLGLCSRCNQIRRVPLYSSPPAQPYCGCAPEPLARPARSGLQMYEQSFADTLSALREACADESVPETFLRMQAFLGAAGAAYTQGDGKAFVSALVGISALSRLLSETVDEDVDDADEVDAEKTGRDP